MKKIFTILAVLGALTFIAVPAQALIGMPDDQPGDEFTWWFLVGMGSGLNTLLVVYEVDGQSANFDWTLFTKESETIKDGHTSLTEYDMDSFDGWGFIGTLAPAVISRLEIDLDNDGTNDHWAGYVDFRRRDDNHNNILAKTMLANIPHGMFSESNVPVKQWNPSEVMDIMNMVDPGNRERFNADVLANAKALQWGFGGAPNYSAATDFHLYPRYYVNSSSGKSYLIVWKSEVTTGELHVDWYDNDENPSSSNIPIPYELNIIDIEPWIPLDLWAADNYPKEGWIDLKAPDKNGAGFSATREYLAWTWILDVGTAAESWSGLAPVARDAN
jgi:hypothetical protein